MKFRSMIRMQMMTLAGLGMLFAGSAYAQQEMDPTPFDDGPYVETIAQHTPSTSAAGTSPAVMTPSDAQKATFVISSTSEANAAVWNPLQELSLSALFVCAACLLLYELAKASSKGQAARVKRSAFLQRGVTSL